MIGCLLVTADKRARDVIKVGLDQAGAFEVDVAEDEWALEVARTRMYQLAVVDTTLAGGADGVEVLRRLREILPSAELLLISRNKAEARQMLRDRQQLGLYGFVHLPIEPRDFFRLVGRLASRLAGPRAA